MLEIEGDMSGEARQDLLRRERRLRQSPPCLETASLRKGRKGIVVGDSLLWGTEGSICRPDPTCREVCCLPGAHIRDIARKVLGDRKSTRLNSSHRIQSRMPSSA